jgi:hypothetical protein
MSADGRRVAFLVSTGPRPDDTTGSGLDLWVTDMSPGVSRKAGSRELTREGSGDSRASSAIDSVVMAADGKHLAIGTARASFVLPGLNTVGTFRDSSTQRDVAVVDLAKNTIERATFAYDGSDTDGSASTLISISGDGGRIAFVDDASNLFYGDANEVSDAFVVTRVTDTTPPPHPKPKPKPKPLKLSAQNAGSGVVRLSVAVPARGTLVATARGGVPAATRKGGKHVKPSRPIRTLATGRAGTHGAGTVVVVLRVARAYRAALKRAGSLRATVKVRFTPSGGGAPASGSLNVTFAQHKRDKR